MTEYTKAEIWDFAAGTFIAVSLVGGMALIIASSLPVSVLRMTGAG